MSNNEQPDQRFACEDWIKARVSKQLKDQFKATAAAQGRSPSEALRQAMADWVQRSRLAA